MSLEKFIAIISGFRLAFLKIYIRLKDKFSIPHILHRQSLQLLLRKLISLFVCLEKMTRNAYGQLYSMKIKSLIKIS